MVGLGAVDNEIKAVKELATRGGDVAGGVGFIGLGEDF